MADITAQEIKRWKGTYKARGSVNCQQHKRRTDEFREEPNRNSRNEKYRTKLRTL